MLMYILTPHPAIYILTTLYIMASPFCKHCLSIPLTNDTSYHLHHTSASALLASAAEGCSLCTIPCDALHHTPWPQGTAFGVDPTKFHYYIENDYLTGKGIPTVFLVVEFLEREMNDALLWNGERGTRERFEVYVPVLIVPAVYGELWLMLKSLRLGRKCGLLILRRESRENLRSWEW